MKLRSYSCCVLSAVICVCTLRFVGFAQQQSTVRANEEDLVIALCAASTEHDVDKLLSANSQLATANLWQRLMDSAAQKYYENHDRSFVLYGLARKVAERLRNEGLSLSQIAKAVGTNKSVVSKTLKNLAANALKPLDAKSAI